MSYQVLARKWRPRSFADMVGQTHVVRALSNALDQDRLHHAYLFTGTRGVGKTTLARILAKALNCESGVSSTPCGQCASCLEIDEGRFVDLLEVDAASRTRVDQTRDLLDNVPFAPVKGRFKVYLIDEVHMFSTSSFNALLKTLEEPPPHVKFLLATTDPQKVPVTVLSRCLQFNLKRLVPEEIAAQLAHILTIEGLPFEEPALALLARAADGSMRDGLSLLDQAIAFGGGRVGAEDIRAMLGTVGRDMSLNLLSALASGDGVALLEEVGRIHELTPDFGGLLQELLGLLHRIALFQQVPATLAADDPEREALVALARDLAPEDVQLFYQIALLGQGDLPLAPDPRTGMEMVLLRMLAFRPTETATAFPSPAPGPATPQAAGLSSGSVAAPLSPTVTVTDVPENTKAPHSTGVLKEAHPASAALAAAKRATATEGPGRGGRTPSRASPAALAPQANRHDWGPATSQTMKDPAGFPRPGAEDRPSPATPIANAKPKNNESKSDEPHFDAGAPILALTGQEASVQLADNEHWHALVAQLDLGGVASELARNCELGDWDGQRLRLVLDHGSQRLRVAVAEQRLSAALAAVLGEGLRLEIQVAPTAAETPARRRVRERQESQRAAEEALATDPVALALQEKLGARLIPGSVRPVG